MGRYRKKRTKSQASPDTVSCPDKRRQLNESDSQDNLGFDPQNSTTMSQSMSQSILQGIPPYPGTSPHGTTSPAHQNAYVHQPPYNPTMQSPTHQTTIQQTIPFQQTPVLQTPIQHASFQQASFQQAPIQQSPIQQASFQQAPIQQTPFQHASSQQTPIQQAGYSPLGAFSQAQTQSPINSLTGDLNKTILDKLDAMDRRLQKLDAIESQLHSLSQKMTNMDVRVSSLESSMKTQERQLSDIEASRAYESQSYDEIRAKQSSIEKELGELKSQKARLNHDHDKLASENSRLSEEILDVQARSMRDNLLFFNFEEATSFEARKSENCIETVLDFCENTLGMSDCRNSVKIDRAHRVGKYYSGKKRPIVAKFNFHQDKLSVKKAVRDKLRDSPFRVSDQYPQIIRERRSKLIPIMIKAKSEGKRAFLSYDKLYVNDEVITADSVTGSAGS